MPNDINEQLKDFINDKKEEFKINCNNHIAKLYESYKSDDNYKLYKIHFRELNTITGMIMNLLDTISDYKQLSKLDKISSDIYEYYDQSFIELYNKHKGDTGKVIRNYTYNTKIKCIEMLNEYYKQ